MDDVNALFETIRANPEDFTVTPDDDEPEEVPMMEENGHVTIGYVEGNEKAGFDHTDFGRPKAFVRVLNEAGINAGDYVRVDASGDDDRDYYNFVWFCDEGFIVTGNNPITGEYRNPGRGSDPGYASYMGVEGEADFVATVVAAVKENAEHIKQHSDSRDFI